MSPYTLADKEEITIAFAAEYFDQQVTPDYDHDPKEWWEVIDRTTQEVVDVKDWDINTKDHTLTIHHAKKMCIRDRLHGTFPAV